MGLSHDDNYTSLVTASPQPPTKNLSNGFVHFQGFVDTSRFRRYYPTVVRPPRVASIVTQHDIYRLSDDVITLYVDKGLSSDAWLDALRLVPNLQSIVFTNRSGRKRALNSLSVYDAIDRLKSLRGMDLRKWKLTERSARYLRLRYRHIAFRV